MMHLINSAHREAMPTGQKSAKPRLSAIQRQSAWVLQFRVWLDDLSNVELRWEAAQWRAMHVPSLAAIVDEMLTERIRDDFDLPHESTLRGLDLLWERVDRAAVLAYVREGGFSLVAAARMAFWIADSEKEQGV